MNSKRRKKGREYEYVWYGPRYFMLFAFQFLLFLFWLLAMLAIMVFYFTIAM